jgi:putative membrane protein
MIKNIRKTLVLFLKGGAIGVANIIPGVSGGTIAVVLGLYDRLIEAISDFFTKPDRRREHFMFLFKVFAGAAVFLLLLANLMDFLLKEYFAPTMFLFIGLILGGIPAVVRSHGDMKINLSRLFFLICGVIFITGISFFGGADTYALVSADKLTSISARGVIMLVLAGFLAGGAMIVPGVSGSFILVLIGQYALIVAAIKALAVKPLFAVAAGAVAGILVFSKIIDVLLKKVPAGTYYFILGLISASIYVIFPGVPYGWIYGLYCAIALIGGTLLSWVLSSWK